MAELGSEFVVENLLQASLLDSGGLLAIFGVPWLIGTFLQYLPSSVHGCLACECVCTVSLFLSSKDNSHWIRGTLSI